MPVDAETDEIFTRTTLQLSKTLGGVAQVGRILNSDGDQIGEIRTAPRLIWGCLTVVGGVVLFFGLPVLVGFAVNEFLKLFNTDLQRIMDRHLIAAIVLAICIVASGILGAMSAAWSLYRRKLTVLNDDKKLVLGLVETGKWGAASLTAEMTDEAGQTIGYVKRNTWGIFTICDESGNAIAELGDKTSLTQQVTKAGVVTVLIGILAFLSALVLGGALIALYSTSRQRLQIRSIDLSAENETEQIGSIIPIDGNARLLHVDESTSIPTRKLILGAALLLIVYDF